MSRETSRSSAPGTGPESPFWTKAAPQDHARVIAAVDVVARMIMAAYVIMAAWQTAKALNPPLKIWQDTTVAALRRRLERAPEPLPALSNDDQRTLYDDTR